MAVFSKTVVLLVGAWSKSGGLEKVCRDIATAFHALGWQVKVVSVWGRNDDEESLDYDVIKCCPRNRYLRYLWRRWLWKMAISRYVCRCLGSGGLLIFGHAHLLPLLKWLPAKSNFKKWVWIYGIEVWGAQATRWIPFLNRLDRVIAGSVFTADQVCAAGLASPVRVFPYCVDTTVFIPAQDRSRIRRNEVLICARMASCERYKGHDILFESIPLAEKLLGFPVTVRVVGAGDDQPRIEALAAQRGLSGKALFLGRVSDEALIESYQHCGVYCMPSYVKRSETGFWTGEGFGIVYVEAASCGRPVIASADGGAPETILEGVSGLLVDPVDPEDVARAIAEILSNYEHADEMGRQGRVLAEQRFSKEQFFKNVSELCGQDQLV